MKTEKKDGKGLDADQKCDIENLQKSVEYAKTIFGKASPESIFDVFKRVFEDAETDEAVINMRVNNLKRSIETIKEVFGNNSPCLDDRVFSFYDRVFCFEKTRDQEFALEDMKTARSIASAGFDIDQEDLPEMVFGIYDLLFGPLEDD